MFTTAKGSAIRETRFATSQEALDFIAMQYLMALRHLESLPPKTDVVNVHAAVRRCPAAWALTHMPSDVLSGLDGDNLPMTPMTYTALLAWQEPGLLEAYDRLVSSPTY